MMCCSPSFGFGFSRFSYCCGRRSKTGNMVSSCTGIAKGTRYSAVFHGGSWNVLGTAPCESIVGASRVRKIDRTQTFNPTRNAHVETEPYTTTKHKSRTTTICSAHTTTVCRTPMHHGLVAISQTKQKRQKMLRESERVSVKKRVAPQNHSCK